MKVTLLFLSVIVLAACGSKKNNTEASISNEELIDSIISLSVSWNDSLNAQIEGLGEALSKPFTFQNLDNEYSPNSILIFCSEKEHIEKIQKSPLLQNMKCANDDDFFVCHQKSINGFKIRYSIRPHPTLKWTFRIERVV